MIKDLRILCEKEEEKTVKERLNNNNHKYYTPIQKFYQRYGYEWRYIAFSEYIDFKRFRK